MTQQGRPHYALVSAASGGIGQAVVRRFLQQSDEQHVIAVSSRQQPSELSVFASRLTWITTDYSEESIRQWVPQLEPYRGNIRRVSICNGILHGEQLQPEKRIEDLNVDSLIRVVKANAGVPMLLLRALLPLLKGNEASVAAVFSARVGSIDDNSLGGWYSYRASKAALNMLLKTATIEYSRRAANVKLIAFHPGTTDTALSKPFQAAVPDGKLFTPDFVAQRLVAIMDTLTPDGKLSYLDWDNKPIAW